MAATMWKLSQKRILQQLSKRNKSIHFYRGLCTQLAAREEDDSHYPPVKGKYPPGNWEDMQPVEAWRWYNEGQKILEIQSVEQRLKHLKDIDPSRFGRKVWIYKGIDVYNLNLLEYQQDKTKTVLVEGLPEIYDKVNIEEDLDLAQSVVEKTLCEHSRSLFRRKDNFEMQSLLLNKQLILNLSTCLAAKYKHLSRTQLDQDVTVEASWDRYGMDPFLPRCSRIDVLDRLPKQARHDEPISCLDSSFKLHLHIRTELPLPEFVPRFDTICTEGEYPEYRYWPRVLGQKFEFLQRSYVPGFKLGDPCEFGHLTVQNTDFHTIRKSAATIGEDHEHLMVELRRGYGMNIGFVSTLAQAHYQGFSTFVDMTYPLTAQTITSDGKNFSFHAYQLNTLLLWKSDRDHSLRNVGWYTPEEKLYESIENGQVKGLNKDVIRKLLKFLCLEPKQRDYNMKPTLPELPPERKVLVPTKEEEIIHEEEVVLDDR